MGSSLACRPLGGGDDTWDSQPEPPLTRHEIGGQIRQQSPAEAVSIGIGRNLEKVSEPVKDEMAEVEYIRHGGRVAS